MAQRIDIDNFWNSVAFYCPACGAEVYAAEGQGTLTPCEHLLFSWIDEVGDYENARPEIDDIVNRLSANGRSDPCPIEEAFVDALPENAVVFCLTHHGMGCGPMRTTVCHAIHFPVNEMW